MCRRLALVVVVVLLMPAEGAWLLYDKEDGPWHHDLVCHHELRTEHGMCRGCGDLRFTKCNKCGCQECNYKCRMQTCERCHKCAPSQNSSYHTAGMSHYVTETSCCCGKKISVKKSRMKNI
eukprot:jgi/Antlo1/558/457